MLMMAAFVWTAPPLALVLWTGSFNSFTSALVLCRDNFIMVVVVVVDQVSRWWWYWQHLCEQHHPLALVLCTGSFNSFTSDLVLHVGTTWLWLLLSSRSEDDDGSIGVNCIFHSLGLVSRVIQLRRSSDVTSVDCITLTLVPCVGKTLLRLSLISRSEDYNDITYSEWYDLFTDIFNVVVAIDQVRRVQWWHQFYYIICSLGPRCKDSFTVVVVVVQVRRSQWQHQCWTASSLVQARLVLTTSPCLSLCHQKRVSRHSPPTPRLGSPACQNWGSMSGILHCVYELVCVCLCVYTWLCADELG